MAKKIALLLSLVMMLSFSCVFATEVEESPAAESEVVAISGDVDVSGEVEEVVLEEEVSGEVADTVEVSGEEVTPASGEETETPDEGAEEEGSSVLGAGIAIVVVVAIVAIVCVLKKK